MDINKELHEKFFPDECWHEFPEGKLLTHLTGRKVCSKCRIIHTAVQVIPDNPQYDSDILAYWRLLMKVKEHKKCIEFLDWFVNRYGSTGIFFYLSTNMKRGTQAINNFNW